ncbi:amino acid ABC transporter substrate-binding protein [Halobium palmae]|uniref:Amino acid ABC transporter substrate-binding protein n=1 Tax=Halobium palmae TaxID=1776492 RepID=A0ABD5RXR2_9EURY
MEDGTGSFSRRSALKTGGVALAGTTGLAGCTLGPASGGGSDGPILVGATIPKSGSLSSTASAVLTGYNLGVEYINANGGIDGREVQLIVKDDESDAKKARSKLQQIVSNNDVAMLWGSFSSLLVTAGSAFAEQQGIPFLGSTFAYMKPHEKKNYEWTFAPFMKSRDIARATREWFETLQPDPPKRLALWELNTGWGNEMADHWAEQFEGGDYEIALRETYSVGTTDFSTLISQTQAAEADAVLSNPVPPDGITAVKQMNTQDFTPKLVDFVRACDPRAWISALGTNGNYVASSGVGWLGGLDTTGTEALLDRYHQQDGVSDDAVPVDVVGCAFGLAQVAAQALRAAESTENTAIQDALLNGTFDTVLGEFGFDDTGMPAENEITPAVGQWYEGDPMLVHPRTESDYSVETVYPMPAFGSR